MKVLNFKYEKKKDGEIKEYSVLNLNESREYFSGISLEKLSEEEKERLFVIQKKYEEDLKPFMSNYRMFLKENITGSTLKE